MTSRHKITVLTPQGETGIEFQAGATLRDILIAGGIAVRSACGGNGACGLCQVRVFDAGGIAEAETRSLSGAQLGAGIRLSCCVIPDKDLHVSIDTPMAHWRALRDDEYSVSAWTAMPCKRAGRYGAAIDLGTTHIRLTLWDLFTAERIAGVAGLNPQGIYGADILTRLMVATRSKVDALAIGHLVQSAIALALADITLKTAIGLHDIGLVLIVGNTAMLSLLSGKNYAELLDPDNWTRRIDCQPQDTTFLRSAWGINSAASIRFVAPLGGFIGSDLLAGVVATRLIEQPAGSMLIDFGTNSEMALWDGHTLHVTATAGGPAFEGCGISCGMPGEAGAIYRVDQAGDSFTVHVLGESAPGGLCGSGLVDAVAWLRRNGRMDKVGRFTDRNSAGFALSEEVVLKRADIDVLQRAKAAIGAGVQWLCKQADCSLNELHLVYACGAFGRLLDVDNAQQIGLLPLPATVRLEGNTALAGCEALLMSAEAEQALSRVLSVCKIYNLAEEAGFESLFVDNLYLQTLRE